MRNSNITSKLQEFCCVYRQNEDYQYEHVQIQNEMT